MALVTPTEFLATGSYTAKKLRRALRASGVVAEGIVEKGDYLVSQRAAGINRSVDVAAGECWVKGDTATDQGYYHVSNGAATNVTIAANASGNPRIDLIVLIVNDSVDAASGSDTPELAVVQGTAKSGATLSNLKGGPGQTEGPEVGNNRLPLAYVLVANGATEIKNEHIGYLVDPRAGLTGYPAQAEPKARAGAPPPYAHGRSLGYVPSVKANRTPAVSVLTGETKTITLDTADAWDLEEGHSIVSEASKIFAKTPGWYTLTAAASCGSFVGMSLYIAVNGNPVTGHTTSAANSIATGTTMRIGYNDYAEIQLRNGELSTKEFSQFHLTMTWIGP